MNKILLCLLLALPALANENWALKYLNGWARDNRITVKGMTAVYDGTADWSLYGFARIPVQANDIFEVKASLSGKGGARVAAITRDANGKVIDWFFGDDSAALTEQPKELNTTFMVPHGIASIEPRLTGEGLAEIQIHAFTAARKKPDALNILTGELPFLSYDTAGITWKFNGAAGHSPALRVTHVQQQGASTKVTLLDLASTRNYTAVFTAQGDEMLVEISSTNTMRTRLAFPPPLASQPDGTLILPENEGMAYLVNESDLPLVSRSFYSGHSGLSMAFFGVINPKGEGWMALVETPDDAWAGVSQNKQGLWDAGPQWQEQKKTLGYTRRVRYIPIKNDGYVTMAKRYRAYAKAQGNLVTLKEKAKTRPNIDKLVGAANIWYWDWDKVKIVKEMQALGMKRLLWSAGGTPEELKQLNDLPTLLTSNYDIYQDVMDPANFDKIRYTHPNWPTAAFPNDIIRNSDGQMRRAWGIEKKDGEGFIHCVALCDKTAPKYARERISKVLAENPYTCRFIDTSTASPFWECWDERHPMTRTDSKKARIELLGVVSKEKGLICGCETGIDSVVPVCDYFEGMMSIAEYRVPDSGRAMLKVWHDVPAVVEKFQVGEKYRIPLWELVYHDCMVSYWYWGDYNNKLPKLWKKRDLFNILYGTPPMYMLRHEQWQYEKNAFAASYAAIIPTIRAVGYSEMLSHKSLSADKTVQQTVFSNGTTVTVNFGNDPFQMSNGQTLPPMGYHVQD